MVVIALLLAAHAWAAPESLLVPELKTFLGPPPAHFDRDYARPARSFRLAWENPKPEAALNALSALAKDSSMAEHALFEIALRRQERLEFALSRAAVTRLQDEYPASPYSDRLPELNVGNDCGQGLAEAKKGNAGRSAAIRLLLLCLQRTPWKEWETREEEATRLYSLLKESKDPLFGPFAAELIQALPAVNGLRGRIQKENSPSDLRAWSTVARFRIRTAPPGGVKAVYPDQDLFDQGMQKVLAESWREAGELFKKMLADYPQSEHLDRARYWIARSEEASGQTEESRRRFEEIYRESPLSYYGLQSLLRLQKDPALLMAPFSGKPPTLSGTLLTRQALSLWKLRALLAEGLLGPAQMEAKSLFQQRPGGATFGQDSADGAALVALLYHHAGYSLAAFSHAHAAVSLDETALGAFTLETIFPSLFPKEFRAAAELSGVHELLLQSVAKQESAFLPQAISRANALGLLQLLLPTAREIDPQLNRQQLFQPGPNAKAGARYLQKLLDRFQGNIALALAGYNAGPSRAVAWQKKALESPLMRKQFDVDAFIDTIPFTETRRYVGSILRNYAWYKFLAKDKINSVQELAFQWQKNQADLAPTPVAPPPPPAEEATPAEEQPLPSTP